jgi:hypothetical protein
MIIHKIFIYLFRVIASISNVGCVSNTECSPEESCINRLCVSPCNCGPNSDCKVYNHYPSCICKPGYYGNPQQGCIKSEYFFQFSYLIVDLFT